MKHGVFTIADNAPLTSDVFRMRLNGDCGAVTAPGQFVNLLIEGQYLRRPISVCDLEGDTLTLICKTVGTGTKKLAAMKPGETLDVLTGLGNGYDLSRAGNAPLLIGGGVGVPPLYLLAKRLIAAGKPVRAMLGFNTKSEVFYEEEFRALGCETAVTTADGSYGIKGFVTDALPSSPSCFYACGPEPMLKAVFGALSCPGQLSFEQRMGCGFGACMGCSCKTITGYKRICKEGPVMNREELLWND